MDSRLSKVEQYPDKRIFLLPVIALFVLCTYLHSVGQDVYQEPATTPECTLSMFDNDLNAFRACETAFALQHNWYPSPIAGLFGYATWNGFDGFWQDGTALETLVNFMAYGNNTMYKSVVIGSLRSLSVLITAYAPQPSYDDMAWYAISYLRIYEVFNNREQNMDQFLTVARQIYDWIWENGWDKENACGGGIWFDQGKQSKKTVENAQMLFLGGKLYQITKDESLIEKIGKTWNFLEQNNVVNMQSYLVADGVNGVCGNDGMYGPSYNMGLMISGLLRAGPPLNRTSEFIELAHNIAEASNKFISSYGVLTEYCTPNCNDDQKMFKGIYLRNLRYLIDFMEQNEKYRHKNRIEYYRSVLNYNSDSVWQYDRCEPSNVNYCDVIYKDGPSLNKETVGPVFGTDFRGPYDTSAPMQQTAVLDLFVSSIKSHAICHGRGCTFDPPIPRPKPLDCNDNPCPQYEECCAAKDSYTCCDPNQRCNSGICE